jgi:citrate lyase subunit beta/citryl-CoA lyase
MIETFFFIPADKSRFINKIPEIKANNFILDFEDSIKSSNLSIALGNISKIKSIEKFWARPTLFNSNNDLELDLIKKIIDLGIKKIIIPKIFKRKHLKSLSKIKGIKDCEFILLIESAEAFNNVDKLLTFKKIKIKGLVLGSHDFVSDLEMKYNVEDLKYFRQTLLIKAKAHNIMPIDIASMEIKNKDGFKEEVLSGFDMGYRSKMILHPSQIDLLDEISFFNKEETMFARNVIEKYPNLTDEIEAVNFEGRILEKPHIKRILEILKNENR